MRKSLIRVLTTGALVAALSFTVSKADAEGAAASTPTQPEAQKQLEAGVKALQAKQWEKARRNLLQAWQIEKHCRIAANLGLVEIELQQYRNAAEHLVYCLRNENDLDEDRKTAVRELFEQAQAQVGTIDVRTDAVGATIFVDGEVVGHTPIAVIFVEPGRRTIAAKMAGKSFEEQPVDIAAGETRKVVLPERPVVTPRPAQPKRPSSDWKSVAVPLGAVITLGGLGVGIGYSVAMSQDSLSPDVRTDKQIGAVIGYSLFSAGLASTVIMALWPAERERKTGLFMAPVVGGGTSGVLVGGAL